LKIITRDEDPSRHYANMKAAAEADMAPRVLYVNVEDKISITDFVRAEPFPISEALVRLPALLRKLHALPSFDKAPFNTTCTFLVNKGPVLDAWLQKFQTANILPKDESEEFFARYKELAAVYRCDDADMVSSHNDLFKPDNILFDGQQVWLVDWEAAFLNDRYVDLATVANQIVANDGEEFAFLREYFGAAPSVYQLARFHLMQQLTHLFYAMAFLHLGAADKPVNWSEPVPAFEEFNRRLWADEVDLASQESKTVYGRVHWNRLRHNVGQAQYSQALKTVSRSA
jgi:hypothetical protein